MTAFSVRLKGMVWICPLPNGAYHSLSLEGYAVDPALMPALLNLLEAETEPGVRVVLDHWLFGYIHPYPDGNGRMARFLMNVMLASGGWPTFAFFEAMKKPRIKILTRFGCLVPQVRARFLGANLGSVTTRNCWVQADTCPGFFVATPAFGSSSSLSV